MKAWNGKLTTATVSKRVKIKMIFCLISAAALLPLLSNCSSSQKDSATTVSTSDASWPKQMQNLAKNLENLFPYVASREEFSDDKNSGRILDLIGSFEKSVSSVPKHAGEEMLGKDPIVKYAVNRLLTNTHQARLAFEEGHRDFSRNLLKENLGLCFSCHTTSQFGPENSFSTKVLGGGFRISASEKAGYYVATRQFDRASDALESILSVPVNSNADLHEQVGALQQYLSLQVRVKKDPKRATKIVERFVNLNKLPYFISVDVKAWLKSLNEWQGELVRSKSKAKSEYFLTAAKNLMKKAGRMRENEGYESGYVDYLRATALLHEGLRFTPNAATKSEIYQLLGRSYETLAKSGTWDLPEVYYEACIRNTPKSPLAINCYTDYERVTVMGFSGSAGTFLPKSEKMHLEELKSISGYDTL